MDDYHANLPVMATVKVFLRKTKYKDGTYPLVLRITKQRKSSYVHLGHSILPKDWDEDMERVRKSHPNSTRLNNLIRKKIADADSIALDSERDNSAASSKSIIRKIKPASDGMFFAQASLYLQRLKEAGNFNVWHAEEPRLRNFKAFVLGTDAIVNDTPKRSKSRKRPACKGVLPGSDVPFSQIDVRLLTQFQHHLKAQLHLGTRTIANYMQAIQSVFRQAIREGATDAKYLPFGSDRIQIKVPQSQKKGLTTDDIEKLELVELSHPAHCAARDLWLVSFYFAGMRAADVLQLKWSDFMEGRLYYVMGKNEKPGSLKIPEKAQTILDRYATTKEHPDDYVFHYLKGDTRMKDAFTLQKRIKEIVTNCNHMLQRRVAPAAGIEGKISMHITRHTFATLAGDKIPIQMLQKLYRHSDIKTTIGYQANFIHKDADEALDAVINGKSK